MTWTSYDTAIALTGACAAVACALPGAFLVLRRMSMMGDAISHTVLPGLAAAFLLTGSRDPLIMFVGAAVIGFATAFLVQLLQRAGKVDEGSAMGIVFTSLFAVGLILIVRAADRVDLDPSCVLYGSMELAPLDTIRVLRWELPRAAATAGAMALANIALIALFYKELRLVSFDAQHAAALGIRPAAVHYLLMTMTAATCVACFEAVGSILAIAMLIVPAATAWLLTERLSVLLVLSVVLAVLSAFGGHAAAIAVPGWFGQPATSSAGTIAFTAGVLFAAAWIFSPKQGLLARAWSRFSLSARIAAEDILAQLYRAGEGRTDPHATLDFGSTLADRAALRWLRFRRLVAGPADALVLTPAGHARAADQIHRHRVLEAYMVDHGIDPERVHGSAHALEHFTSEDLLQRLDEATGNPGTDPHHRAIPRAK